MFFKIFNGNIQIYIDVERGKCIVQSLYMLELIKMQIVLEAVYEF